MNRLANEMVTTPRWRLGAWAARAWRRMGWRHVLLALLIEFVRSAAHPLGGIFFTPVELPGWDPALSYLDGRWAVSGVPIVYGALVADEAFDDGVPALRAYGLAAIAMTVFVPMAQRILFSVPFAWGVTASYAGFDEGAAQFVWWLLAMLYESSFGLSIYAYWRVTQRAMRQAHAAEVARVRSEQRVQAARLLALQARVDPQLLFDALGRVGALHAHEPKVADALMADLIALLRSMQPGASTENSTVEREFALVEAWLRVTRSAGHQGARVRLHMSPGARPLGIAPMLVLPLLRDVLALPRAAQGDWVLDARVAGLRLLVTLHANGDDGNADAAGALASADLSPLRDRLAQLFGQSARLGASPGAAHLTLDLPVLQGDGDDDGTDR